MSRRWRGGRHGQRSGLRPPPGARPSRCVAQGAEVGPVHGVSSALPCGQGPRADAQPPGSPAAVPAAAPRWLLPEKPGRLAPSLGGREAGRTFFVILGL